MLGGGVRRNEEGVVHATLDLCGHGEFICLENVGGRCGGDLRCDFTCCCLDRISVDIRLIGRL